jgi:hypothetical protein
MSLPPLQPVPPRAPPCPGRPVALAPVRSSRCVATSTHRPSSTPRSNCSPAWLAPPRHCLLYSRRLPKLHAPTILSPWPRSDQADAPTPLRPSCPPCPGLCHLGLWHASAAPRRRLTTDHHRRRLCSACRLPKSGRWLWTSPSRPPPLDATSRLGPPPPDAISRPPRALVRYSSPYRCK